MADTAVHPEAISAAFEPPMFATASKKTGMWLFLLSDSLTFGVLLFAYSYGRISNTAWPMPFHKESIINSSIMTAFLLSSSLTMVLAVMAARRHDAKWQFRWLLATMLFGAGFVVLHAYEWTNLIAQGMRLSMFPVPRGASAAATEFTTAMKTAPQFAGTFFTLTGMHMLHVTLGIIYLGVVALRKKFIPILVVLWLLAWLLTPPWSVFHYGAHVLLAAAVVASLIVWLKPKVYDSLDVEVSGLYWHFVDLVWMFIFPLVYLMSTRITG